MGLADDDSRDLVKKNSSIESLLRDLRVVVHADDEVLKKSVVSKKRAERRELRRTLNHLPVIQEERIRRHQARRKQTQTSVSEAQENQASDQSKQLSSMSQVDGAEDVGGPRHNVVVGPSRPNMVGIGEPPWTHRARTPSCCETRGAAAVPQKSPPHSARHFRPHSARDCPVPRALTPRPPPASADGKRAHARLRPSIRRPNTANATCGVPLLTEQAASQEGMSSKSVRCAADSPPASGFIRVPTPHPSSGGGGGGDASSVDAQRTLLQAETSSSTAVADDGQPVVIEPCTGGAAEDFLALPPRSTSRSSSTHPSGSDATTPLAAEITEESATPVPRQLVELGIDPKGKTSADILRMLHVRNMSTTYRAATKAVADTMALRPKTPQAFKAVLSHRCVREVREARSVSNENMHLHLDPWEIETIAELCRSVKYHVKTRNEPITTYERDYNPSYYGMLLKKQPS